MNQSTRQRIVGSIVLLVAALILLPVIFDGEGSYQRELESSMPEMPPFPETESRLPERPIITADTEAINLAPEPVTNETAEPVAAGQQQAESEPGETEPAAPQTEPAVTAPVTESTAVLDNQGLPQGWSVRLASFSSAANATALIQRLQDAGHRAYSRPISSSQGPLTGVYVGPLTDRSAATALLEQLRQEFQLAGMVVRYEIEPL